MTMFYSTSSELQLMPVVVLISAGRTVFGFITPNKFQQNLAERNYVARRMLEWGTHCMYMWRSHWRNFDLFCQ